MELINKDVGVLAFFQLRVTRLSMPVVVHFYLYTIKRSFRNLAAHRVINVAEILGCSRQNIIDLTKRGKLHPIETSEKSTLCLKSEILKRNWQ